MKYHLHTDKAVIVGLSFISLSSFSLFCLSSLPSWHLLLPLSAVWSLLVTPPQSSSQQGLSSVSTHILHSFSTRSSTALKCQADEAATPTWHISSAPAKSFCGRGWVCRQIEIKVILRVPSLKGNFWQYWKWEFKWWLIAIWWSCQVLQEPERRHHSVFRI